MTKTKLIFIFLFAVNSNRLLSQVQIREVDITGISKNIIIDSIINVPKIVFDSIIMDQLTVPQEIERLSKCYGCSGTTFVSFIAFNKKLIETKTVRGFNNIMDSVLFIPGKLTPHSG
jgi:hypothetical protein